MVGKGRKEENIGYNTKTIDQCKLLCTYKEKCTGIEYNSADNTCSLQYCLHCTKKSDDARWSSYRIHRNGTN